MTYYLMDLERTLSTGLPCFWRKNKRGYTYDIYEAGIYERGAADEITKADRDHTTVMIKMETVAKILQWEKRKL